VRVPFEVLGVKRGGAHETYATERLDNGVRLRIGRADVLLPRGRHVYEIAYRTARQVGHFGEHDELYWNVNGTGWTLPMEHVSAEVFLPVPVQPGQMKRAAYTGGQGARGRDYISTARDGGAVFITSRALAPREGLTIVVGFPKGIVAAPAAGQRARWLLADNAGLAAGAAALAAMAAFLFWRWSALGRDPRAGPAYPRYEAPPGLGAAGTRYVDRMGYDERCFAAALLGLGARGYLKIRESGGRYQIERTGGEVAFLPAENELARGLFPAGAKTFSLGQEHQPAVQAVRDGVKAALERHFGARLFSRNYGPLFGGAALGAPGVGAMAFLDASALAIGVVAAAMVGALVLFARLLPAYSVQGRRLQDAIEGLRQYLSVAEKDDLARLKAPPQTKEEFAKLLPYAVALDVEKTWADRFAAVLGAAAVAAAVSDYYSSDGGGLEGGGIGGLTGSISDMGGTIAAASSPPGSSSGSDSGGGNGGSSGGGGGGGGGSGW